MNWRGIQMGMFAAAAILLAGCNTIDDVLGSKEPPPLPGSRIPVLLSGDALQPDPGISDLAVLLPKPLVNESWPQQGGFANHAMHHLALGEVPRRLWSADAGSGADDDAPILSGPVTGDGRVYTMDADAVVAAHSTSEGRLIWRSDIEPPEEDDGNWGGGLAVDGGIVFAATGFAQVVALAADSGQELWRTNVSGPMRAAPTAFNGRVFAVTKDNQLFALNAEDGDLLWSHTGIEETAGLIGSASPAVDGDIVVVPYSSGEIFALRVENGRQLWVENLAAIRRADAVSALADIRGRPVIDRGRAGDFIFVLTTDAVVAAITARDGRIRWLTPIGLFEDPAKRRDRISWAGPVLAGDRLILTGSHGIAMTVSPYTGDIIGEEEMPDAVSLAPAVANETLYFLTDEARLVAYR
jgi:outer membrane protein assembly factor BamB